MLKGKWVVLHADDLGLTKSFNAGVCEAYLQGFLTSASIRTNGAAFNEAVAEVVPACKGIGLGLHLNVVEGKSQRKSISKNSKICKADGTYKLAFPHLLWAHRMKHHETFAEIRDDFRCQIEMALETGIKLDHLNSHQHSHAIPSLFKVVCQLAQEYRIPFVRLVKERFYVAGGISSHFGVWYPTNLIKHLLLNGFSYPNKRIAEEHEIETNDFFVGLNYAGHMTAPRIWQGLQAHRGNAAGVIEVLVHPCRIVAGEETYIAPYLRRYVRHQGRQDELAAIKDEALIKQIEQEGWVRTNYSKLAGARG